jgi:tRNA A37 threonylcarbamoyladenosine synthetase subunit TsaC/SUA5/YrdC
MQPLSIMCRSLSDIDTYTTGFPQGTNQGQANFPCHQACNTRSCKYIICLNLITWELCSWLDYFNHVQYTFILPASKQFPKQCIKHGRSTRYAKRKQVGVRIPDDPICQAILQNLDEPLICTRFVVELYFPLALLSSAPDMLQLLVN